MITEQTFQQKKWEISPMHAFILSDGTRIMSLQEMADSIRDMPKESFDHYVNQNKNDIAEWVEHVHLQKSLADRLRQTKEKELSAKIIQNFIETEKDRIKAEIEEENEKNLKPAFFAGNISNNPENNPNIFYSDAKSFELPRYAQEKEISVEGEEKVSELSYEPVHLPKEKVPVIKRFKKFLKKFKGKDSKKLKPEPRNQADTPEKNSQQNTIKNPALVPLSSPQRMSVEPDEDEYYEPEFLKIGVPGFDELVTNGIPKGSSVLLCGGAGTGKTTFSLQLLNYGAENKRKCLYLTFEEETSRLRSHMKGFGWDPKKLEKEGYLKIKKMDPFEISRSVEALLAKASGELIIDIDELEGIIPEGFRPDLVVLDSLSAVSAAFVGKEEGYRIYVEQLFTLFKKMGVTSFLISEVEENASRYTRNGVEEFLADAVIVFYNLRQKSVRVNALEIIKIRGTSHQKKIVPFKMIACKGITVFPKEDPFIE